MYAATYAIWMPLRLPLPVPLSPGDWLTVVADHVGDRTWQWLEVHIASPYGIVKVRVEVHIQFPDPNHNLTLS